MISAELLNGVPFSQRRWWRRSELSIAWCAQPQNCRSHGAHSPKIVDRMVRGPQKKRGGHMRTSQLLFGTASFLFADHICHHQFQKKKTRDYMIFQSCSFEEQHAARHALLQSNMPPDMLFCKATCRLACSSAQHNAARHALQIECLS